MSKLILGTAQIGMNYGVNNILGKIRKEDAFKILNLAYQSGIEYLDTAPVYGDAQKIIGEFKNKEILKNFFGTESELNKYNGYLQKGDIYSLGLTMYIFLDYYRNYFKNSNYNDINLNNSKLLDLFLVSLSIADKSSLS